MTDFNTTVADKLAQNQGLIIPTKTPERTKQELSDLDQRCIIVSQLGNLTDVTVSSALKKLDRDSRDPVVIILDASTHNLDMVRDEFTQFEFIPHRIPA